MKIVFILHTYRYKFLVKNIDTSYQIWWNNLHSNISLQDRARARAEFVHLHLPSHFLLQLHFISFDTLYSPLGSRSVHVGFHPHPSVYFFSIPIGKKMADREGDLRQCCQVLCRVFVPKDQNIRPNEIFFGPYLKNRGLLIFLA